MKQSPPSVDQRRDGQARGTKRIAAIDIGSNSVRQLIADVSADGSIAVVDELKAAPRLGAGLAASGMLSDEAISRAVEVLGRMALLARQRRCDRVEVVATSAVRDASNRETFIERVRKMTGLQIRVLAGEDEARLSFRSALAHFDLAAARSVVLDIGGGSLELAFSAGGVLERLVSLPLGAVRMTERYPRVDVGRDGLSRLRRHARRELRKSAPAREWRKAQIIGSGGTLTNLAGMYLSRRGVQTARGVHGTHVPRAEVEHILDSLAQMSPSERLRVPGLNGERADIIVAGIGVVAEVLAWLETGELVVSRYGIREGIVLEAARVAPRAAVAGDARTRSVVELAERCGYDPRHANHVRDLALLLFDALRERLGLADDDRPLLADAAFLHDIGYHIGYDTHHKHSYHIIQHADLLGTAPLDQVIIANIARYHRGALPKRRHRQFGALDRKTRRRIKRLAALLRIADGFDRGHVGAVDHLDVRFEHTGIVITPVAAESATSLRLELWGASRKVRLLERVSGGSVELLDEAGSLYEPGTLALTAEPEPAAAV